MAPNIVLAKIDDEGLFKKSIKVIGLKTDIINLKMGSTSDN